MEISDKQTDNKGKDRSLAEQKRLFSLAATALIADMLCGKVEIDIDDIKLDITNGNCGAIFIDERLSHNSDFQKMCAEKSCLSELKKLAQAAMEDKL
jgi:hypothetical protein